MKTNDNKTYLFSVAGLIASASIVSAATLIFDNDLGDGDFFAEANWQDSVTGLDPAANTVNPSAFLIDDDLVVGGSFNAVSAVNIRLVNGRTLTVQDDATLTSLVYSAANGESINVVVEDNANLIVTQNIARTAFFVSGNADLVFSGPAPEFTTDSLDLASDWTGSITLEQLTNRDIVGTSGAGLFNTFTIDGAAATISDVLREDILDASNTVVGTRFTLVPEPSSGLLLCFGSVTFLLRRKRI